MYIKKQMSFAGLNVFLIKCRMFRVGLHKLIRGVGFVCIAK